MIMSLSISAEPSAYISMRFGDDEIIDTSNELCQVINQCNIGVSLWHKAIKKIQENAKCTTVYSTYGRH